MTLDDAAKAEGTRIPDRPDFPVDWENDLEPALLWTWDDFHSPLPPTPMSRSVGKISREGGQDAGRYTGTYRPGGLSKVISGYPYGASTAPPLTEEEKAEHARIATERIATVRSDWDNTWLPELKSWLKQMKQVELADLDAGQLWQHIDQVFEFYSRAWFIHMMVVRPVIEQSSRLDRVCGEILGEPDEAVAPVLLHGEETMTVSSIKELERLSELARNDEDVRRAFEQNRPAPETTDALKSTTAGQKWLASLESYLHDFGYRCTGFDISFPTWIEDRTFVYQVVRNTLSGSDAPTAEEREQALNRERDELLAKVRDAGKSRPDLLAEFDREYETGQRIWPLKEDHSHYIDQASMAIVRLALAEVGRRLARDGTLKDAEDVWYIDLDEAESALTGNGPGDLKKLVAERRADRERNSKITPPKYLGTFPPDHDAANDMDNTAESGGTLRGTAASKGEATGIARVVLSPDDFHKVQKGDVLVCRSTAPMWTPLFRVVSALVSEAGGILSHPAVVAREFELPAVVGVRNATRLVRDGQPVTVSGTDGLVHAG